MSFPRYERYKDSGVEWLGKVPEHWQVRRLRYSARLVTEKATQQTNPLALENIESWTGRLLPSETKFEGDGTSYRIGDLLFGKLRPYLAKAYLAESEGEAVGDFHVMRPSPFISGRFLFHQLINRDSISLLDGSTFGSKMPRVGWDFMANMVLATPPIAEQARIADFIAQETAKIDALIEEQRRLIDLLKEKRQAAILQTVTEGLNPNAPMKDSGVDLLGMIPAGWVPMKVTRILDRIEQGWSPDCFARQADTDEWGVVKSGCVNRGVFAETENKALPTELDPNPDYEIKSGDVLMSRASGSPELVGSTALVGHTRPQLMLSDKIFRIILGESMRKEFFVALFNSALMRSQIERAISGAGGLANNLPQSALKSFWFALPLTGEQEALTAYIAEQTLKIDTLLNEAELAIHFLQERRSALISSAVTGKIDVRKYTPKEIA